MKQKDRGVLALCLTRLSNVRAFLSIPPLELNQKDKGMLDATVQFLAKEVCTPADTSVTEAV